MPTTNQNIPVSGMTSSHPMNVKDSEYMLMLNGNIQTDVSAPITLTNEHSNILCNNFPEDYKLIGSCFVPQSSITYVFLVNPLTNKSQIGYLTEYVYIEQTDTPTTDPCDNCETVNIEQPPLETITPTPTCTYFCIAVSDCLNFNIDFPIRKAVYKKDNCGSTLYFTDFYNPVRALKLTPENTLDETVREIKDYTVDCNGEPVNYNTCDEAPSFCTCCQANYYPRCDEEGFDGVHDVDCLKIRLFPQTKHICIKPHSVNPGGVLRAGTYQLAACYADSNGQRATRTFACSNPVPIFDPNQTITDQLSYPTSLSIKFLIEDLDSTAYKYINIFVVGTINNVPSVKEYENIEISSLSQGTLEYVLTDFEKGKDVTIDDILQVFPVYDKAKEITTSGDTLLLANLTSPRDLNLQRAVIGMSPAIKWMTAETSEDFYANGINAANYRTFLRDEVYTLGIVFEINNTLDTCTYPLIGRSSNTSFGAIEVEHDDCLVTWESWVNPDSVPGKEFVTDPGFATFNYVGEWIPTREYSKRDDTNHTPYEIVSYNGLYYICITNNINNNPEDDNPFDPTYWAVVPDPTSSCILCVSDTNEVSGVQQDDIILPPGCDIGGEPKTYDKTWEVYNTACNLGKTCNPEVDTVECVDEIEEISCSSFRFEVPTVSATWEASVGPYPEEMTFILTVNANDLGLVIGSTVLSDSIDATGLILTGIDASGNVTVSVPSAIDSQTTPVTISFLISCDASGIIDCGEDIECYPLDCYVDKADRCGSCEDNYFTGLDKVEHCTSLWDKTYAYDSAGGDIIEYNGNLYESSAISGNLNKNPTNPGSIYWTLVSVSDEEGCPCPVWPKVLDVEGCNPGYVRTRTDALDYYNANGRYLLCIDATLAGYSNILADPYAVKTESKPVKILDAITKDWYKYDLLDIQSKIISSSDPTKDFMDGSETPESPICFSLLKHYPAPFLPIKNYLFPVINLPESPPDNYDPYNAISAFNPSSENKCNDYGVTAPLMYMLGEDLITPSTPACCDATGEDCYWEDGDYWNIASGYVPPVADVNNNKYQSYWYNFTATALQPTIIIKNRIFYKFGEFFNLNGLHFPNSTTVGSKDYQEQGDFRIDVYEGSFTGNPVWSTGSSLATYYYTGTEADQGVLIIGDVANSTGQSTTSNQLPLITGTTYYVHIYLLPQGVAKVNKQPILNQLKQDPCPTEVGSGHPFALWSCCPCYFANYAWMNMCINSATSSETRNISLPETWEVECKYNLHYRHNKLIDNGCAFQTFEYGNFAFWESATKTYPNSPEVWGDLCNKPIRHFKFPDVLVSKIQNQDPLITYSGGVATQGPFNPARKAKIYPIGVRIDPADVSAWLDWAAIPDASGGPGLITDEERASITGYKIVRGNRVGNKSIAAKGLLFDMWKYKEYDYVNKSYSNINTFYPNYPFNDLRIDPYLNRGGIPYTAPYGGIGNDRYSFLSPETTFNSPVIGYELKLESIVFGDALGNFYTVKDHPKYILLSNGGIALAATLAGIQLAGDLLILIGELLGPTWGAGVVVDYPVGSIVGMVGGFLNMVPSFFVYAKQWRDIIINFGHPQNFAKYYAAVGNYHSSGVLGEVPNAGNKRRQVLNSTYLLAGNLATSDNGVISKINNYQREDSVYLFLKDKFDYTGTLITNTGFNDSSKFIMSSFHDVKPCFTRDRESNVASYYASVKYNLPDQYGEIHDIEWLYTGSCVSLLDSSASVCDGIFGGDTFISRMTQKRKIPFFLDNPVGAEVSVDFQYQHISNITNSTYYFNSVGESLMTSSNIQFKEVEHNFDCETTKGLYLNGVIYLFSYGITSFICESDFNLNYRYATDDKFRDFYPHQSDIENWTQEYRIPIETPNAYLYNRDYSKQNKENFFCTQSAIYSNEECITTYKNRVINSIPDKDSDFYTDPWRIFLANDYKDFPLTNGDLVGMDGLEKEKVILRFNNTTLVFNAYYTMTTDAGVAQIGTASMFAQKPLEFSKTEIGYAGTQHHAFVITQYGSFWVDTKRSAVFMLPTGDSGVEEISQSFNNFFNNNLPFFILKSFPNFDTDNNYKQIGISIGWDNKFDRLFLTKLDYELKSSYIGQVTYENGDFYYQNEVISLTDTTYFCNKSWTIAYSPATKSWISYYSFIPNYYIGHENYFQTGINYSQNNDQTEIGVWNHLITNKSYQVFYGKLYPFITDVVLTEQLINKQLQSIEYQTDFLRFQNDYDYFYNPELTFNKMLIWSDNRNSGNLELVPTIPNNMAQAILYPRVNANSTSVLVTRKENSWRVNQFFDLVSSKVNNVPPMTYGCHPYLKQVNPVAIDYNKPTFKKSRLTSDYFILRFINDKYSNYKIIQKWFLNKIIKSYT